MVTVVLAVRYKCVAKCCVCLGYMVVVCAVSTLPYK